MITPTHEEDLAALKPLARGQIPRGLGRSYGDAAQLAGGTVVDMTELSGAWLDADTGLVTARAGTSLGAIIDTVLPAGWFLPVTPGTRHVTVGGAIAADVHGKNHHRDGSLGQHLESFELIGGDGSPHVARPGSEVFAATVGGMGLTGIITRATFRLIPIETSWMSVDTARADDLDSVMQLLADADARSRYSVGWVDLSSSGRGRGVVSAAEHATRAQIGDRPVSTGQTRSVATPRHLPRLISTSAVGVFNRIWFALAPHRETARLEPLDSFFYPLDRVEHWNRLYGRMGFLQYQFVVPGGGEETLVRVAEALGRGDTPVALAVLKRMGESEGGLLSFPMPGWTLAVDMPLGDYRLARVLDECDEEVAAAGGRVYLAKDSRMRAEMTHHMYPDLGSWRSARARLDPAERLRSNLSERLGLTG